MTDPVFTRSRRDELRAAWRSRWPPEVVAAIVNASIVMLSPVLLLAVSWMATDVSGATATARVSPLYVLALQYLFLAMIGDDSHRRISLDCSLADVGPRKTVLRESGNWLAGRDRRGRPGVAARDDGAVAGHHAVATRGAAVPHLLWRRCGAHRRGVWPRAPNVSRAGLEVAVLIVIHHGWLVLALAGVATI